MKLMCAKFHVNQLNCVKSRKGGGGWGPKCSCNCFFFESSRVKACEGGLVPSPIFWLAWGTVFVDSGMLLKNVCTSGSLIVV